MSLTQLSIKIRRQASRTSDPIFQTYQIEVNPNSQTVLDALHKIQWEQDGTLVFRRNCRNVICGSCGMKINGRSGLACQKLIGEVMEVTKSKELVIEPMANLPVVKDLVVDMDKFWQNLSRVDPYVSTASRQISAKEFVQTPNQRQKLQASANCILCGSCYSECQAVTVNPEFVGPHALSKAFRTLADNRDIQTEARIAKYNNLDFAWGCTRCFNCNEVCPVEVAPLDRISEVKQEILASVQLSLLANPSANCLPKSPTSAELESARAIRHRTTMVELVKESGWIDESKFGVTVVGDNFRDWKGILSLIPLGMRMIWRSKMPYPWQFKPSIASKQIKMLIESIQARKSKL
jgi:succinate dehydrogenase / fumarate reductase, iron-sulfur subunit